MSPADQIVSAATDFVTTRLILDGMCVDEDPRAGIEVVVNTVLAWLASRADEAGASDDLRTVLISALAADQVKGTYDKGPGPSPL